MRLTGCCGGRGPRACCELVPRGHPRKHALYIKPLPCKETRLEPNESQEEVVGFHKAQRLAVFAQFLEEGEVRKKTILRYRVSLRINLSG